MSGRPQTARPSPLMCCHPPAYLPHFCISLFQRSLGMDKTVFSLPVPQENGLPVQISLQVSPAVFRLSLGSTAPPKAARSSLEHQATQPQALEMPCPTAVGCCVLSQQTTLAIFLCFLFSVLLPGTQRPSHTLPYAAGIFKGLSFSSLLPTQCGCYSC